MRRVITRLLLGAALAGGLGLLWSHSFAVGKPARRSLEELPMPQGDRLMGTATCASMSCHHVNGPRGSARSEYSTWAAFDKHARAFQVLYDERSERIARNLYGPGAHAYKQQLCLNCHSMKHDRIAGTGPRFSLADGVGCESCHGPAERWLTTHYQPGFKELPDEEKQKQGMWPTKNLVVRGQACADCHVGNIDNNMEVNHDLIAAGHPRLNFEYAGFLHMYARHWLMADEKARHPDFHARVWAIGQVMSARASVKQLNQRALAANKPGPGGRPWPEFTEYDCFACHKDLKVINKARDTDRDPGALPYGTWYLPLTGTYAKLSHVDLDTTDGSLEKLKKLMEKPGTPPEPVAAHSANVLKSLDNWLGRLRKSESLSDDEVRKLLEALAANGQELARKSALDWDVTAQHYLAIAALNQGLGDLDKSHSSKSMKKDLQSLGELLRKAFPPDYDSPVGFDPRSPTLEKEFKAIRDNLGKSD